MSSLPENDPLALDVTLPEASADAAVIHPPEIVAESAQTDPPLFQSWEHLPPPQPPRVPHIGHFLMLGLFAMGGLLLASLLLQLALHFHLYGVSTLQEATDDIHYNLASEGILYLVMILASYFFFPLLWGRTFFAAIEWNGAVAARIFFRLVLVAMGCFLFAVLNSLWLPGPKDAPIDKIFHSPGAPWLLFAFGTTIAPFCEELVFRGFLLPSLCTACDWTMEKIRRVPPPELSESGQPQWSKSAMIAGSLLTSLPFAAMHAAQTAYSVGPFLLLICVSLVLCATRLLTRSLASSIVVHSSYNFLLFAMMLLGTAGFQQLDKL